MAIQFSPTQWDHIKQTYREFWSKSLRRPVVGAYLLGRDPGRLMPDVPLLSQATCADYSISAEQMIDRLDYELSCVDYMGDAFPMVNMAAFGPGIAAAFMGAELDNTSGQVWFHPPKDVPIQDLHLTYDGDNRWLQRIREIYQAGMRRWQGQVLMGIPDLGGCLDILSTFRPGEKLLLDLYDAPGEVMRLIDEIHKLWHRYYQELAEIINDGSPGITNWSQMYCESSFYILQCDFAYMIGPEMFDCFVMPELKKSVDRLDHSIYHLDGKGQIPHLQTLLALDSLDGIQWVPGDGEAPQQEWLEVHQDVARTNRLMHLFCGWDGMDEIAGQLGGYRNMFHVPITVHRHQQDAVQRRLDRYMEL